MFFTNFFVPSPLQVTFVPKGPLKEDVHGLLTVKTEQGPPLSIQLHSTVPEPSIRVEPTTLVLGTVVQGSVVEKTLTIRNDGKKAAHWAVKKDPEWPVSVEPRSGFFQAGGHVNAKVVFDAKDAGEVTGLLEFKCEEPGQTQSVEVSCKSVPQRVELCGMDGNPTSRIDFGSLYFGSTKTVRALLKNQGPAPVSFNTTLTANADGVSGDRASVDSPPAETLGTLQVAKCLQVSPESGTIPPFSETVVEFSMTPARDGVLKGFTTTKSSLKQAFSFVSVFDMKELNIQIKVQVSGQGVEPAVTLTPTSISFGDVGVNGHSERTLTLVNGDGELPVRFEFSGSAEFHVAPNHGSLPPGESRTLTVRFDPKVIGPRQGVLTCSVSAGDKAAVVQKLELRLAGRATVAPKSNGKGSLNKTGLALASMSSNNGLSSGLTSGSSVGLSGGQELEEEPMSGPNIHRLTRSESQKKEEHRAQYTQYLKTARLDREERSALKPPPPDDALNLGLDSFSGLREPDPAVPTARDPLWLIKDVSTIGKEGSYVRPKNRPLQTGDLFSASKFKARPCEPGESRECHSQLRPSDIVKIVAGPHSLDFGRVSALAAHTKVFTVTNKLHKSILVGVESRAVPELARSEPESQVIPPGATAGFSIVLCTTKLQSLRQKVDYVINGQHRQVERNGGIMWKRWNSFGLKISESNCVLRIASCLGST
jgi:hypothetical protein